MYSLNQAMRSLPPKRAWDSASAAARRSRPRCSRVTLVSPPLGSNVTFGGTHTTGCHQDFALKQQRFYLDDELVADSGKVIPEYLH